MPEPTPLLLQNLPALTSWDSASLLMYANDPSQPVDKDFKVTLAKLIEFVVANSGGGGGGGGGTMGHTVGDFKASAQTADHTNWLLCDGREVSRTEYNLLFAAIGEQFGIGNSTTTFNLPDLRSRVLGAVGQGPGFTNRAAGTALGIETHTLTISQMPAHNHTMGQGTSTVTRSIGQSLVDLSGSYGGFQYPTSTVGGNSAINNMQPTLFAGSYFICTISH